MQSAKTALPTSAMETDISEAESCSSSCLSIVWFWVTTGSVQCPLEVILIPSDLVLERGGIWLDKIPINEQERKTAYRPKLSMNPDVQIAKDLAADTITDSSFLHTSSEKPNTSKRANAGKIKHWNLVQDVEIIIPGFHAMLGVKIARKVWN